MHEITLCQRALELIEQQARANNAKRVTGVWLQVGAFSCVETSALTFCFELVCRGTLAEGCELHIEEQQAECWCAQCQSSELRIVADDGMQIQRLEIEKE